MITLVITIRSVENGFVATVNGPGGEGSLGHEFVGRSPTEIRDVVIGEVREVMYEATAKLIPE